MADDSKIDLFVVRDICGTPKGYSYHTYLKETPCTGCKKANAERIAEHRAQHGRQDHNINKARNRALSRLGREYPERLQELYIEEKRLLMEELYGKQA